MHPIEKGFCSCVMVSGVNPGTEKFCPVISTRSAHPRIVVNCVNARTYPPSPNLYWMATTYFLFLRGASLQRISPPCLVGEYSVRSFSCHASPNPRVGNSPKSNTKSSGSPSPPHGTGRGSITANTVTPGNDQCDSPYVSKLSLAAGSSRMQLKPSTPSWNKSENPNRSAVCPLNASSITSGAARCCVKLLPKVDLSGQIRFGSSEMSTSSATRWSLSAGGGGAGGGGGEGGDGGGGGEGGGKYGRSYVYVAG